ncbi:hypothetical protein E4K64_16500 [Bradyrhizobium frederickii]|uniref:Uncharacterized protein n=1 Tax=Bradyrhizobium frederickii TaxID=2560054 RepID=A0A4Y9P738_9BRAD|nr:hypothetical protein [Bradyrhizobium frederickii]TFV75302.1 hypothetical protein E4K64_16500 [Bradyrhizobium frederickii]
MFRKKSSEAAVEHSPPQVDASVPRAPAVREKLDCALGALAELEAQGAEYALQAAEREPGAADKLAGHRSRIEAARTAVAELRAALQLAQRQDNEAELAYQAAARDQQLRDFAATAEEWTRVGVELAEHLEKAAGLRIRLGTLSEELQRQLPIGIVPHPVDFKTVDILVGGVANPTAIDALLAGEMFKHGQPNAFLPGARPPHALLAHDRPSIEPAATALRRAGAYFVGLLRDRFDALKSHTSEAA